MKEIKNLIFDMGNVLLDLDWDRVERAFRDMLREEFDAALLRYQAEELFLKLEVGLLTPREFTREMQRVSGRAIDEQTIINSWNAILVQLPAHRLRWLQQLGAHYDLYLLSNTNAIHLEWLDAHLREQAGMTLEDFNALFVKPYYSFEINLRKPDREIYEFVIADAGIDPAASLFIDDMEENLRSAKAVGLQILHHPAGTEIVDRFAAGKDASAYKRKKSKM